MSLECCKDKFCVIFVACRCIYDARIFAIADAFFDAAASA